MSKTDREIYLERVLEQLFNDLAYPVDKDGNVLYTHPYRPGLAYHLVRAGWRKPNNTDDVVPLDVEFDEPMIKAQKVHGPGVFEDSVTWVGFNEPDDPLEDLQNMTMKQIESLPDHLKVEAKRRLGLPLPLPETSSWSVVPTVTITDAEDVDDHTALPREEQR